MNRNWALGITGVGERVFLYQLGLLGDENGGYWSQKSEGENQGERERETDHQNVVCVIKGTNSQNHRALITSFSSLFLTTSLSRGQSCSPVPPFFGERGIAIWEMLTYL